MTAIQKRLLRKWISALRSRKYKQGKGTLRQTGNTKKQVDRFCCLGVLCDIVDPDGWISPSKWRYLEKIVYSLDGDSRNSYLPNKIKEKIGLNEEEKVLTEMNDNGKKFNKIADYLEKKYLSGEQN